MLGIMPNTTFGAGGMGWHGEVAEPAYQKVNLSDIPDDQRRAVAQLFDEVWHCKDLTREDPRRLRLVVR